MQVNNLSSKITELQKRLDGAGHEAAHTTFQRIGFGQDLARACNQLLATCFPAKGLPATTTAIQVSELKFLAFAGQQQILTKCGSVGSQH